MHAIGWRRSQAIESLPMIFSIGTSKDASCRITRTSSDAWDWFFAKQTPEAGGWGCSMRLSVEDAAAAAERQGPQRRRPESEFQVSSTGARPHSMRGSKRGI